MLVIGFLPNVTGDNSEFDVGNSHVTKEVGNKRMANGCLERANSGQAVTRQNQFETQAAFLLYSLRVIKTNIVKVNTIKELMIAQDESKVTLTYRQWLR